MKAFVYRWHKKLALIAGVLTLLWVLSGLIHPFLSVWGPRPAAFKPPEMEFGRMPSAEGFSLILDKLKTENIEGMRLVRVGYAYAWQVRMKGGTVYFDADYGKFQPLFGETYATALASHYTGGKGLATDIKDQTQFDLSYPPINRLLPVTKVALDTGVTVYVDPWSDRLGGITDTVRVAALWMFQTVHTLSFLDRVEYVRVLAIALSVSAMIAMAMLGLAVRASFKYKAQAKASRFWHGTGAYLLWIPVLMMAMTGLFHLGVRSPLVLDTTLPQPQLFAVREFKLPDTRMAFNDLRLQLYQAQPVWRVRSGDAVSYFDAKTGWKMQLSEAEWARSLTRSHSDPVLVTTFTDEYGFAYKRLPVWKFEQGLGFKFVDPVDGVVSATVTQTQVSEQWVFTRLHKWQFLDGLTGKRWRDAVLAAIAVLIAGMAVTGLVMRGRKG